MDKKNYQGQGSKSHAHRYTGKPRQLHPRPKGFPWIKALLSVAVIGVLVKGYDQTLSRKPEPVHPVALSSVQTTGKTAAQPAAETPPRPQMAETKPTLTAIAKAESGNDASAPEPEEEIFATEERKTESEVSYVMERNGSNSYTAEGYINGNRVTLLADTGATHVVVPELLATKLGLNKGAEIMFGTAGGKVMHHKTTLDTLTLGRIQISKVAAVINPAMKENFVLLGMSALSLMNVALDKDQMVLKYKLPKTPGNADANQDLTLEKPFAREVKDCAAQGNKFDQHSLECLRGNSEPARPPSLTAE